MVAFQYPCILYYGFTLTIPFLNVTAALMSFKFILSTSINFKLLPSAVNKVELVDRGRK
jgi:hypothetical protein